MVSETHVDDCGICHAGMCGMCHFNLSGQRVRNDSVFATAPVTCCGYAHCFSFLAVVAARLYPNLGRGVSVTQFRKKISQLSFVKHLEFVSAVS